MQRKSGKYVEEIFIRATATAFKLEIKIFTADENGKVVNLRRIHPWNKSPTENVLELLYTPRTLHYDRLKKQR